MADPEKLGDVTPGDPQPADVSPTTDTGDTDTPEDAVVTDTVPDAGVTDAPEDPAVTDVAPTNDTGDTGGAVAEPQPDTQQDDATPAGDQTVADPDTPPPPPADATDNVEVPPEEEEKQPVKVKPEKKPSVHRAFDSAGSLYESDSFVRSKLEELKQKRNVVAKMMKEIQQKIDETKSKRESTREDYLNLKQYHADFLEKIAEYESISRQLEQLIGMPDVPTSQLDLKMSVPSALKLPKKKHEEKKDKPDVPLLDDSLDDKLPKVIVCGNDTSDPIPRIIVCEPVRKADLEPFSKTGKKEQGDAGSGGQPAGGTLRPSTGVGGRLNEAIENQQKLATENAKMARDRSSIQKELFDKQDVLENMKQRILALESQNRKIMLENEELQKRTRPGRRDDDEYPMCKREYCMKQKGGNTPWGAPCCQMGPQQPYTQREITPRTARPRGRSLEGQREVSPPNFPFKTGTVTYMGDVPPSLNMKDIFTSPYLSDRFPDRSNMTPQAADPMNYQQAYCKMDRDKDLERELDKMGGDVKNIYCELDNLQKDKMDLGYGSGARKPPICKRMLPQKSTQTDADKELDIFFASEKDPKLKDLREQYKRLHSDFKNKVSEVAALRVDLDKTKTELESLTIIHHELEAMHQKELDQNYALNGEKKQLQAFRDQILDLEHQANLAKQMYKSCQDEMEETRLLIEEQAGQLDDYRNKYMKTLQIAEELKKENEFKERECADQLAVEIQKVKQEMQEQLEELSPIKDLLKITQQKLNETEQMHNVALETIADMSQRMDDALKEVEALKSQKKNNFDEEAAANLAVSLEKAEKKLTELENDNERKRDVIANLESVGSTRKQQLEEKAQELLQLESQLETLREESARQVARVKERSDMIRKCLQAQIAEMEKEVAQGRAATAFANRERDEIRSKLQMEIILLSENFRESQNRIVQLQQHVNYLNASHPTSLLNIIK